MAEAPILPAAPTLRTVCIWFVVVGVTMVMVLVRASEFRARQDSFDRDT